MIISAVRPGVEIAWASYGAPGDPTVLLIAGAGAPAAFWPVGFCERMASAGLRVLRFDHRDTGQSTHFDAPYDLNDLLLDAIALLDHLDAPTAHWVGHSMGGYLVQLALCEHPGRIRTATSISAGSYVSDELHKRFGTTQPSESTWRVLLDNKPTGDYAADLSGWMRSWRLLHGKAPMNEIMAAAYTRALYVGDPRNAQVAENHVLAMATVPQWLVDRLGDSSIPLLVLHGTDDLLVPVDNGRMTAQSADAEMVELAGAGHMFFNDRIWLSIEAALTKHFAGDRAIAR